MASKQFMFANYRDSVMINQRASVMYNISLQHFPREPFTLKTIFCTKENNISRFHVSLTYLCILFKSGTIPFGP